MYSNKELENIKNSLKFWSVSPEQKQCVINLIANITALRSENNELLHFKQTSEFVLNKESLEIIKDEMEAREDY